MPAPAVPSTALDAVDKKTPNSRFSRKLSLPSTLEDASEDEAVGEEAVTAGREEVGTIIKRSIVKA